ncbi:MAG: hypothetical protein JNL66_09430 [Alphaproteobacteria bacterium]|nr:hypothetical protein [Alphaproteobacteria bacterium]
MTRSGFSSTSPGVFGCGIGPRLAIAVAVVVVLWTAMAWAVTAPSGGASGRDGAPLSVTGTPLASGA